MKPYRMNFLMTGLENRRLIWNAYQKIITFLITPQIGL